MKTQPRQHISNKYNTCTIVTSPVYIGSKETIAFSSFSVCKNGNRAVLVRDLLGNKSQFVGQL